MAGDGRKRPQSEPEIIPPGQQPNSEVWASEIYVRKVGPFEIILWVMIVGAVLTLIATLLFGLFLIMIPLAVALIAIAIVSAVMRGYFRRQ
jgi:uncharacterized membrane protein YoaK (UPF0700 family)